jgi:protein-disulfide isomerase
VHSFLRGCALLLAFAAAGCSAQNSTPPSPANSAATGAAAPAQASGNSQPAAPAANAIDPALKRKIEIQIRNRFSNLPPSVQFDIHDRKASDIAGWDQLTVDLITNRGKQPITLYISKDNKQLAHIERFNLENVPGANVNTQGRPVRGNPNAKVTVITFDDFQCPYCSVMHQKLFPTLLNEYGSKVKFIYKDFPLESIHPWAIHAAVNANCLNEQKNDAYWDFADFIHAKQQTITKNDKGERRPQVEQFSRLDDAARDSAKKFSLDTDKLNACMKTQDDTAVRASMKEGEKLDIDGTPTLFINGERIGGDTDIDNVRAILDRALIAAGEQPPQRSQAAPQAPAKPTPDPAVKK